MVSGWHMWNKHRKTAIRISFFIISIVIAGLLLNQIFKKGKKGEVTKEKTESVKKHY